MVGKGHLLKKNPLFFVIFSFIRPDLKSDHCADWACHTRKRVKSCLKQSVPVNRVNLSLNQSFSIDNRDQQLGPHYHHAQLLIIFVFEICLFSVLLLSLSVNRNIPHRLRHHHCQPLPPEKVPQLLHPIKVEYVNVLMQVREVAL